MKSDIDKLMKRLDDLYNSLSQYVERLKAERNALRACLEDICDPHHNTPTGSYEAYMAGKIANAQKLLGEVT